MRRRLALDLLIMALIPTFIGLRFAALAPWSACACCVSALPVLY